MGGAKNWKDKKHRRKHRQQLPKPPQTKKTLADMSKYIAERFTKFAWPEMQMENLCGYAGPQTQDTHKTQEMGGAQEIIKFTPSQEFVRHYFQPSSAYKGLLAYHSVGTGKSCTAIATASTAWEPRGYTILYVTRTALRGDIYKNLFDQICSVVIKQQIKEGLKLPENVLKTPTKFLSKNWFVPISLKQFSNICEKKNKMYHELVKIHGEKDPLKKTLVILDEAHKLFAHDIVGAEKPNVPAIYAAVHQSYDVSGDDSVRMLIMTATPYTNNPMDFIKLMNLMRPASDALPENIQDFSAEFLDDSGTFNSNGGNIFANKIAGYISYLNRSEDMRQFARPKVHAVNVPMSVSPVPETSVQDIEALIEQTKDRVAQTVSHIKDVKRAHKERVVVTGDRMCADQRTVKERKLCKDKVKQQLLSTHTNEVAILEKDVVATKEKLIQLQKKKKDVKHETEKMKKEDLSQETALHAKCKIAL
jgi:hypothetical protein